MCEFLIEHLFDYGYLNFCIEIFEYETLAMFEILFVLMLPLDVEGTACLSTISLYGSFL
jgi:hypothetical protein